MARRTCVREQYYTDKKGIILGRVDGRPRPEKIIYKFGQVFHQYLEIAQFVWDRAVCGTRYWVGAGCGCSGVAQNIHMRQIRLDRRFVHDEVFPEKRENAGFSFSCLGALLLLPTPNSLQAHFGDEHPARQIQYFQRLRSPGTTNTDV